MPTQQVVTLCRIGDDPNEKVNGLQFPTQMAAVSDELECRTTLLDMNRSMASIKPTPGFATQLDLCKKREADRLDVS